MIALDLRRVIARAVAEAGWDAGREPKLRPGGRPGTYASSIALGLAPAAGKQGGRPALDIARTLAGRLGTEDWIERAIVTGEGYVTVTVTPQALASVAARITAAAAGCVGSDVLRGVGVSPMPPADLEGATTWEDARAALAAELTATLAATAGATVAPSAAAAAGDGGGRGKGRSGRGTRGPVGDAVAFAGADAVRFALARAIPGKLVRECILRRHALGVRPRRRCQRGAPLQRRTSLFGARMICRFK